MLPRAAKLAALAGFLLAFAAQAAAQTQPDPPQVISPLSVDADRNGVNLATGRINFDIPTLSVSAAPRLKFDRVQNAAPYVVGTTALVGGELRMSSWSVHYGGEASESFKCTDGACEPVTETGSLFQLGGHKYTQAGSGAAWEFNLLHSSTPVSGGGTTKLFYASHIKYPDGEDISFTYDTAGFLPGDQFNRTWYRPLRIDSTTGYYITITYQYAGNDVSNPLWGTPAEAKLFAPDNSLVRRFAYAGNSVTDYGAGDPVGRTYQITGVPNALGNSVESIAASLQLPTEASTSLTTSQVAGYPVIGSVVRDGVTWSYAYTNIGFDPVSGNYLYTKVSAAGPNGYAMSYDMANFNRINAITKVTDALGRATNYVLDPAGRVTQMTLPEGNSVVMTYDGSGNINSKVSKAKPGSGLADIAESATYPCTTVPVICWRPSTYTDARGNVTNYAWNNYGQLTQQDDPADPAGVRRRTINDYTLTGTLSRKSRIRVCAAGATALTCSGAPLSETDYTYVGNTLLPATVTVTDNANCTPACVTKTTTYTYDNAGRLLATQGPMNGVGGTKYFRYDTYGRKSWEIGAADANNLRLAKRFTYRDSDDKVTKVETGTVTCPTNCNTDPLTLTLLEQTDTTYDSRRYPIRELTSSGGTAYRVTDRSFLDRGLADCTAVRMDFLAPPPPTATSACTLGTPGAQGPDRITKNLYDNAGELTKIQKAFGVTTANGFPQTLQQDYVTYAYTLNSKQQFVTDANGNKAQYKYDGFDRLQCWIFPSKTTPGTVSGDCITTGDYEKYTYDSAGNRLSLRRRDGRTLTFSYDNLNRMLSKLIPDGCPPIQPPGTGCPAASATRDVFYGYDLLGRQLTAKFDSSGGPDGVTNAYDGFGNVTSSTVSMAGFTKAVSSLYDLDNNRTRVTHPDASAFTYTYDSRDRLAGVYEGIGTGTALDGFLYNADDTLGARLEGSGGGGNVNYGYDPIGRLQGQVDAFVGGTGNVQWNFQINPASQILSETRDNDSYAFTGIATATKAYGVNGLNQYTAVAGSALLYDANGNVTSDPAAALGATAYIYDGENRLVSAMSPGQTVTLTYDPLGRLWQLIKGAANTRFLTDGNAIVGEYDGSGTLTNRYVHGSNLAADDPLLWYVGSGTSTKRYLHADHLGSIIAATNGASAPTLNAYDEYGVPKAGNVGRFQYTGQIWLSELGLYDYKARLYSPYLGRFVQTDPVGYEGGVNLYAYVNDDPMNASDPAGTYTCKEEDCAQIEKARKEIVAARNIYLREGPTGTRINDAAAMLGRVLNALGTMNDSRGPTVTIDSSIPDQGDYKAGTIRLNEHVSRAAGNTLGHVLAHEGWHYVQDQSGVPQTTQFRMEREYPAFIAGVLVDKGLHRNSELYTVGESLTETRERIRVKMRQYCYVGGPMCEKFIDDHIPGLRGIR